MQSSTLSIRKSVFFVLNGALLLLSAMVFFLYRDKNGVQQQNRELIIRNDSILSVNILLTDSVKQKTMPAPTLKNTMTNVKKRK